MNRLTRFIVIGLSLVWYCHGDVSSQIISLEPGKTVESQKILIDREIVRYIENIFAAGMAIWLTMSFTYRFRLTQLVPHQSYEVRISFPSTNPVSIKLWLEENGQETSPIKRRSRKLLHAEKFVFRTDGQGNVVHGPTVCKPDSCFVAFQANRWALSKYGKEGGQREFVYDVILEPNSIGIPHSVLPIVAAAIVAVLVVVALVPWWTHWAVPHLVQYMSKDASPLLGGKRSQ